MPIHRIDRCRLEYKRNKRRLHDADTIFAQQVEIVEPSPVIVLRDDEGYCQLKVQRSNLCRMGAG